MKRLTPPLALAVAVVIAAMTISLPSPVSCADTGKPTKAEKQEEKRGAIDYMAEKALEELKTSSESASELLGQSYGHAVFSNIKISALIVSGGGGEGVATDQSGKRIYMKMGTGGLALGAGGQKYQVVFMFETEQAFNSFVEKGWKGEAGASAAAGTAGANKVSSFHDGLAIFQLTDTGLMASADVTGTKYWKNKKLNAEN